MIEPTYSKSQRPSWRRVLSRLGIGVVMVSVLLLITFILAFMYPGFARFPGYPPLSP